MSIAVLNSVYDEMRRLAIAGSSVAVGDFRLKKLLPPLEQAGAQAPVFARVAQAVKAVVESNEKTAPNALLELTTLVNAILFTQGETGAPGALTDIETTELIAPGGQASARVLKPLLEALKTTGSGRLEIIRDAHERGAFRDLRLVKPALDGLDDVYSEVADLVAEKILPTYGKAIVPELRKRLDIKEKGAHPRRLKLLHTLDPEGTREFVMKALEEGSKEVKVVAIECLGSAKEDLSYLIEQAGSKAQDVRQAAYRALAGIEDDAAATVLQKALTGKDLELAARSIRWSQNEKLLRFVIDAIDRDIAELLTIKNKKDVTPKINRIRILLWALAHKEDPATEAFLLKLFGLRSTLEKIKGTGGGGADLNEEVVSLMASSSPKVKTTLAEAHATLEADEFENAFEAALEALPPERVYDMFSPYVTAKPGAKKSSESARRQIVCGRLGSDSGYWVSRAEEPMDPRWLDLAVALEDIGMISHLGRPGHAGVNKFLSGKFEDALKKSKKLEDLCETVSAMVSAYHPDATDAFVRSIEKHSKKLHYHWWFLHLVLDLPKSAVPRIEALVPTLPENMADTVVGYLEQLRNKKE